MERKGMILFVVLLLFMSFSCSDNESEMLDMANINGVVLKPIPCQTDEGEVYEIELDESIMSNSGTALNKIPVLNLPNAFRQEGTRIKFDMRQTPLDLEEMGGFCVQLYDYSYFFYISNIKIIEQ